MIRPWPIPPHWLRRCPLCSAYDDGGLDEEGLWLHLTADHAAVDHVAAAARAIAEMGGTRRLA